MQAVGHIPVDVKELSADLLSVSAHKLYGPKGVGALYIRKGIKLLPLAHGGEQERGYRAGTENVPGIAGFGKAAELVAREVEEEAKRLTSLRDRLIKGLLNSVEWTQLNGHPTQRLPNNVNTSFEFVEGESLMLALDLENICVSTGSACSTTRRAPSHVLLALGLPPGKALSSLRMTLGRWTTEEEMSVSWRSCPGQLLGYELCHPSSDRRACQWKSPETHGNGKHRPLHYRNDLCLLRGEHREGARGNPRHDIGQRQLDPENPQPLVSPGLAGESLLAEKRVGDEAVGATINRTGAFKFRATRVGWDATLTPSMARNSLNWVLRDKIRTGDKVPRGGDSRNKRSSL